MILCSNCGAKMPDGAEVCEYCGNRLNEVDAASEEYEANLESLLKTQILEDAKELGIGNIEDMRIERTRKEKNQVVIWFSILMGVFVVYFFWAIRFSKVWLLAVLIIGYYYLWKKKNNINFLVREAKNNPDVKIKEIVSDNYRESQRIENEKPKKTFNPILWPMLVTIITSLFFIQPFYLYAEDENGAYVIRYISGITGAFFAEVPRETDWGENVYRIGENAFSGIDTLIEVSLPDSIEKIDGEAFKNCRLLEDITIPYQVTEIRGNTFEGCTSLKNVNLHDNITAIHGEAFLNCESLESIKLPSKITEVRGHTFNGCTKLESIVIPEDVVRIGGSAFRNCVSLQTVLLPDELEEIGINAFANCSSLTMINIPEKTEVDEGAFKGSPTQIIRKK